MSVVRVYNDNTYPYTERFEDEMITINPGAYLIMEENKANRFKGSFNAPKKTPQGAPDPTSYKMIRLAPHKVEVQEVKPEPAKFLCQFDGQEFESQEALDKYIDENHLDKLQDQELAEKRRKAKAK